MNSEKGAANLITTMFYLLISFIVLALATTSAITLIANNKEKISYERMLDIFENIDVAINDSVSNKQEIKLNINNPGEIYIDCENNKIVGKIKYTKEFKTGTVIVSNLSVYKKNNELYFEKEIEDIGDFTLYCENKEISIGKQNIVINYFNYDTDNKKIMLDVYQSNSNKEASWYSSKWAFRKKIVIDHTKVEEDLFNFPVMVYLDDEDILEYSKGDGTDLIFTAKDGKTILKREIEDSFIQGYKKKITIDHTKVIDTLENFPVLISLEDEDLKTYALDGSDIYFTLEDEETRLKREIELFDVTTGTLVVWVKIPELSSTEDTDIYMNFGDPKEDNSDDTEVWDDNFSGVWHGYDSSSTRVKDSTNNNNPGRKVSGRTNQVPGKIGDAQEFNDMNNDYIQINTINLESNWTFSKWIYWYGQADNSVYYAGSGKTNDSFLIRYANTPLFYIRKNDANFYQFADSSNLINGWAYVTWVSNDINTISIYINGNIKKKTTLDTSIVLPMTYFGRGYNQRLYSTYPGQTYYLKGILDEIRVSSIARSDTWIKTEYNNQNDPTSFYSVGELKKKKNADSIIAWVKVPKLSTDTNTEIYVYFGNKEANFENDNGIWDSDYLGVWHNNDYDAYTVLDSSNNNNGIKKNKNEPYEVTGKIGFAQNFEGINKYINTNIKDINLEKATISFWVNFDNLTGPSGNQGIIFGSKYNINNNFSIIHSGAEAKRIFFTTGNTKYASFSNAFSDTNTWYYFVFSYDSTKEKWKDALKFYINGNSKSVTTSTGEHTTLAAIGDVSMSRIDGSGFSGKLDEVRFYKNTRDASWIKAEYHNQNNPTDFMNIKEIETI